jgi:hypothetical protein
MKQLTITLLALAAFTISCKKDPAEKGIYKGPVVQVHNGKAWTWVQIGNNNIPERLGITIDDAALASVPVGTEGGHNHENNFVMAFHGKAGVSPFKHVWLNWNPAGHEPENIYTLPHFDIHYYTVTSAEREAMVDPVKLEAKPAADYIPANHIDGPGIPTMGKHWIDFTSPELGGQVPFTQTFILGSYDSKVVFYEPMITKAFLEQTPLFERPIPQPAKFKEAGYYPTKMRIVKHDGVTEIILDGFVYRQAS